eukprot:scaffold23208_cov93-Amphora_coffeaeformis.AAC.1
MSKILSAFLQTENLSHKERDFVGISHKVAETTLTHDFDVQALSNRIDEVFDTYYNKKNRDAYVAPYLCFVQSSGMGKTKILYELKKSYDKVPEEKKTTVARLVLCRSKKNGEEGEREENLFDVFLHQLQDIDQRTYFERIVEIIFNALDEAVANI